MTVSPTAGHAQTTTESSIDTGETLKYAVLYTDRADVTHFRDNGMRWQLRRVPYQDATSVGFLRIPAGVDSDWHPAPRKQFVMVLEGVMEVEAGDGEKRRFEAGNVLLVTDTEGTGHRTRVAGNRDVLLVWVPIP